MLFINLLDLALLSPQLLEVVIAVINNNNLNPPLLARKSMLLFQQQQVPKGGLCHSLGHYR